MADNITVTPGSGATVACDDVGGVLYQRIKQAWGVDGAAVDVSTTNPLPVKPPSLTTIATGQVSVTTSATLICASRADRTCITVIQEGSTLVRLGPSGVTALTGVPLPGTQWSSFTIEGGAALYGIVATGTQTVSYIEEY